jgi:hypothetical protein
MIGVEAAGRCRLHVHVYDRDVVRMGRTSYGTPVFAAQRLARRRLREQRGSRPAPPVSFSERAPVGPVPPGGYAA